MNGHQISFSFKHKRLCEKWFDNLFMVLYNDLRVYTALKMELVKYKAAEDAKDAQIHRKTGAEWEMYAQVAFSLHHEDDAIEGFKQCMQQKLSTTTQMRLMYIYSQRGNIQECLTCMARLVELGDQSYVENTFPSSIGRDLFKLIKQYGLVHIQNALISLNTPASTYRSMTYY